MTQDVVDPGECSMCFSMFLEKKVYPSEFGWNVLKISMRIISSNASFKTCVSLLIFCLDDLSISVSRMLKSPCRGPALVGPGNLKRGRSQRGETYLLET